MILKSASLNTNLNILTHWLTDIKQVYKFYNTIVADPPLLADSDVIVHVDCTCADILTHVRVN